MNEIPVELPWKSPLAKNLDQQTVEQFFETNMFSKEGRSFYEMIVEEALCSKLSEVSALDFIWCIKTAGSIQNLLKAEKEWIVEGAQVLINKIAKSLGNAIIYDSPVNEITHDSDMVTVQTNKNKWKARRGLIAVPLNLIERIHFTPSLPEQRVELANHSELPPIIKMIVFYNKPFWRENGLNGKVYSNQSFVKLVMDSSPPNEQYGILSVFISGEGVRMLARKDNKCRQQEIIKSLIFLFGKQAGNPLSIYEKNWTEDQWTLGGYGVHFPTDILTKYGNTLIEPVGSIYWAGTEVSSRWRMYMEGAVQSGQRAAQQIIESLMP